MKSKTYKCKNIKNKAELIKNNIMNISRKKVEIMGVGTAPTRHSFPSLPLFTSLFINNLIKTYNYII